MQYKFKVFSANWLTTLFSTSPEEAAIAATKLQMESDGELFMIAPIVVVVKAKTNDMSFFKSPAILEDLHMYAAAKHLRLFIEHHNL